MSDLTSSYSILLSTYLKSHCTTLCAIFKRHCIDFGAHSSLVGDELEYHGKVHSSQEHTQLNRLAVVILLVFEHLLDRVGTVLVINSVNFWQDVNSGHIEERPCRDKHQDAYPELQRLQISGCLLSCAKAEEEEYVH